MLKILDNPRQVSRLRPVLRSPIAGLSDEELALLKLSGEEGTFHEAVIGLARKLSEEEDGQQEAKTQQDGDTREQEPVQKTARMSGAGEAAELIKKSGKQNGNCSCFTNYICDCENSCRTRRSTS